MLFLDLRTSMLPQYKGKKRGSIRSSPGTVLFPNPQTYLGSAPAGHPRLCSEDGKEKGVFAGRRIVCGSLMTRSTDLRLAGDQRPMSGQDSGTYISSCARIFDQTWALNTPFTLTPFLVSHDWSAYAGNQSLLTQER